MNDMAVERLKTYLKQRLTDTWAAILITLAIFFLSAYLPPPLKFFLWVLCMISIIYPLVRGIIRGINNKD
jgi:hypothetical protein